MKGDTDSVEISAGKHGLRRTQKPPMEYLNSFSKEFQYSSIYEEFSSRKTGAPIT